MTVNQQYLIWGHKKVGNSCVVLGPSNVDRDWELQDGISRVRSFPTDATIPMHPKYPRLVGLTDNLRNLALLIVVSKPLQQFLEAQALKNVEYLPISILNHKRRVASSEYSVVHPVNPQDCLDLARSKCKYNALCPDDIDSVERIELDSARLDPAVALFRIKDFNSVVLVRRALADQLLAAGFSGLRFDELDDYED